MTCPEFDCCECGRHIIVLAGPLPDLRLCAACMTIPGWLDIPAFRAVIDPEGHIHEPVYTALPAWEP